MIGQPIVCHASVFFVSRLHPQARWRVWWESTSVIRDAPVKEWPDPSATMFIEGTDLEKLPVLTAQGSNRLTHTRRASCRMTFFWDHKNEKGPLWLWITERPSAKALWRWPVWCACAQRTDRLNSFEESHRSLNSWDSHIEQNIRVALFRKRQIAQHCRESYLWFTILYEWKSCLSAMP